MNRRSFLRSLLALPFAAKIAEALSDHAELVGRVDRATDRALLSAFWMQAPRRTMPHSQAYLDALDRIMSQTNRQLPEFYCGPEQAKQLNEIFAKLYAVRK